MALTQEEFDRIMGNKRKPIDNVDYGANYKANPLANVDILGSLGTQLRQMANNAYVNVPNTVRAIGAEASSDPFVKMFQPITPKPKQNYTVSQAPANYQSMSLGDQRIQDAASILLDPINAIPFAGTAAKGVVKGAKYLGKEALKQVDTGTGVLGKIVPDMNMYAVPNIQGIPINEILYPNRTLDSLNSAEKSALTKFTKTLGVPAVRRREELRIAGGGDKVQPSLNLITPQGIHPTSLFDTVITPLSADQAATGGIVEQIAGIPLEKSLERQGGRLYPFIDKNYNQNVGWSSEQAAANSKIGNFKKNAEKYDKPVVAVYDAMGNEGINFSHHQAPAMVAQLHVLQPSKSAINAFDDEVRSYVDPKTGKKPFANFSGVTSPNVYDEMQYGKASSTKGKLDFTGGKLRTIISEKMAKGKYRDLGFPRYEDVNKIMSEEGLYAGASGKTIFQPDVSKGIITPDFSHSSYSAGMPRLENGLLGGIENAKGEIVSVPDDVMWVKTFNKLRAEGKKDNNIRRSMQIAHHGEVFDQQNLDAVMKYLGY